MRSSRRRRWRGSVVGYAFVIDLPELGGRTRLERASSRVLALCAYAGD